MRDQSALQQDCRWPVRVADTPERQAVIYRDLNRLQKRVKAVGAGEAKCAEG